MGYHSPRIVIVVVVVGLRDNENVKLAVVSPSFDFCEELIIDLFTGPYMAQGHELIKQRCMCKAHVYPIQTALYPTDRQGRPCCTSFAVIYRPVGHARLHLCKASTFKFYL